MSSSSNAAGRTLSRRVASPLDKLRVSQLDLLGQRRQHAVQQRLRLHRRQHEAALTVAGRDDTVAPLGDDEERESLDAFPTTRARPCTSSRTSRCAA